MARERTIKLTVLGDASSANRALRSMQGGTSRLGSAFSAMGRLVARGAVAAGAGLAAGAGFALAAANEAEVVAAKTGAVIKSTRGLANVTAKDVNKLAMEILNYSGISDEAIASAQNILLTFTKVRNEVGKGNDIFEQATKRIVDMSVALDMDLQSAAIMIGKALNDPIKGISAMSRAGIQFTEDQKEMIEGMVEAGDTLGAQKIILGELETQFQGTARAVGKTTTGQWNRFKETVGNLAEELGTHLQPMMQKALGWLRKNLPDIVEGAKAAFEKLSGFISNVKGVMGDWVAAIDRWFGGSGNGRAILGFLKELATAPEWKALWGTADELASKMVGAFRRIRDMLRPIFKWIHDQIKFLQDTINSLIDETLNKLLNETIGDLTRDVLGQVNEIRRTVDGSQGARPGPVPTTPVPPSGPGLGDNDQPPPRGGPETPFRSPVVVNNTIYAENRSDDDVVELMRRYTFVVNREQPRFRRRSVEA